MRSRLAAVAALLALAGCQGLSPTFSTDTPPRRGPGSVPATGGGGASSGGRPKIVLSSVSAAPGQTATVSATLRSGGANVAGTQNDIGFDPRAVSIVRKPNGKPDCQANAALGKEGTAFNFLPQKCGPGACTSVRALVLSLSSVSAIPDGSVLYTCKVEVAAGAAPGARPLTLSRIGFSDPGGKALSGSGGDGTVTVGQ